MVSKNYQMINRKLGRPPNASQVKCPAKSRQKVRKLKEEKGEDHSGESHFCNECACGNTAGKNTTHPGYGWCEIHERGKNKDECMAFAEKHKLAIQAREEFETRDVEQWIATTKEKGEFASHTVELTRELQVARDLLKQLIETLQKRDTLTEYVNGKLVPMSDKTVMEMTTKMLTAINRLGVSEHQMTTDHRVAEMIFDKAMAEISDALKKYLNNEQLKDLVGQLGKIRIA